MKGIIWIHRQVIELSSVIRQHIVIKLTNQHCYQTMFCHYVNPSTIPPDYFLTFT